jgi:hypothetical protein
MAKVAQGCISGLYGMDSHTSIELFAWADLLRAQVSDANNPDDPKWLRRRADRLAALANAKAKSVEHKRMRARRSTCDGTI